MTVEGELADRSKALAGEAAIEGCAATGTVIDTRKTWSEGEGEGKETCVSQLRGTRLRSALRGESNRWRGMEALEHARRRYGEGGKGT